MRIAKLLLLATLLSAASVGASEWKVVPHQGRDYVSFANVAEFYRLARYSQANRTVSLRDARRTVRAQADTSELYINGVRFFTNFPIVGRDGDTLISATDVGKIIEPVLRPSRIDGARGVETVVLDPGHGGTDQGTANAWGTEKGYALDVAVAAREHLLRAGFKVEMTRLGDVGISLEERVEFANGFRNAVFVSIHFNSATGGNGVESYALAPAGVASNASAGENHATEMDVVRNPGNDYDGENMALTAAVHAAVLSRVAPFDRGIRHARFKVLRNITSPALLLEGGFLSDPVEGQRIATSQYRQQLGAAIAQGVQAYNRAATYRSGSPSTSFATVVANLPPHARSITEPLAAHRSNALAPAQQPSVSINAGE
ncbi:MAG: N-acetylmuramoyl-L-alanine amidase [Chthoniobacterales bacterium]|nr:N-acetylmuramoyl-L-alanine amidase [Chthoniobacterales bacterium]